MAELLLDSDIRLWVFLPIVVITFLVGIIRHYVTILLSTEKKVELQQISDRYFSTYKQPEETVMSKPPSPGRKRSWDKTPLVNAFRSKRFCDRTFRYSISCGDLEIW